MTLQFRAVIEDMISSPDRPQRKKPAPIRLSQNELPWGPLPQVEHAMREAVSVSNRYPDYHRTVARGAVAKLVNVPAEWVAVDNGSGTFLQNLARLVVEPGTNGVHAAPSFDAYEVSIQLAGGDAVVVGLTSRGEMDLEAMLAAVGPDTRIIYICNPNNPTGGFVPLAEIRSFLQQVPDDVLVVLDEAYKEFVTDEPTFASIDLVREFDNLTVLRTLSKAYGLAGIRIGYLVAQERIALALRRTSVGFSLNSVAEAALVAALGGEAMEAAQARISTLVDERQRFVAALEAHGIDHLPTTTNFIFLPGNTDRLFEGLREHGVAGRPMAHAGGVRLTFGTSEENDAALAALSRMSAVRHGVGS